MATTALEPRTVERLTVEWEARPGLAGVLSTVDHKIIGKRYLVTAFGFLILGGIEALLLRSQLVGAERRLLSPELYNQLFSMHGVTMIFLYASPVLSGFGNYLWPLMLGSRDMAFPRLNALSYWIYLFAGGFLYLSPFLGAMPDDGWFNYVPFANRQYSPGLNIDFYALALVFLGLSTTVGSINFVVTFFKTRAPGMTVSRVPIIMWGTLTASVSNLMAVPSLTVACILLFFDRRFGTRFYETTKGGSPILWQHLFWMFGHPWVYVVVLPAMGLVSDMIPTFARRPLVGYAFVALSTVATAVLGFGVWVHHMFATGLPPLAMAVFESASMVITVPSGIAVFAWLATLWHGRRPTITTAFLYALGFIVLLVIGGVSGVMTAAVAFDWQLTDTYFVVAHLHYVLIGINLFAVLAAIHYWFPKLTGRMMDERLGRWSFWIVFIGTNLTFFPMHVLGMLGMPRRVYTYPRGLGWDPLNLVETIGAFLLGIGIGLVVINAWRSRRRGAAAGPNPWNAPTLEWATSSPPPAYNFAVLPIVTSRHPLWDRATESGERAGVIPGPELLDGREILGTSPLDAEPGAVLPMPEDSYWPLLLALSLLGFFIGLLFGWTVLAAATLVAIAATGIGWLWRGIGTGTVPLPAEVASDQSERKRAATLGFWGMGCLVATEAAFFAFLLFSYFYLAANHGSPWPPRGRPELLVATVNTGILLASSAVLFWAERRRRAGRPRQAVGGIGLTLGLGLGFLALQVYEYGRRRAAPSSGAYDSLFVTITGFHGAHVLVGAFMLAVLFARGLRRGLGSDRSQPVRTVGLYWHFVDVVWLAVFTVLYLSPRFG